MENPDGTSPDSFADPESLSVKRNRFASSRSVDGFEPVTSAATAAGLSSTLKSISAVKAFKMEHLRH